MRGLLAAALVILTTLSARAAPVVELRVVFGPGCTGVGVAIHLGGGLFVTAGHLLDPGLARREGCPGAALEPERPPTLIIDGLPTPAAILRRVPGVATGDAAPGWAYPGWADLALLRVAVPPSLPAARPCPGDAAAGDRLRVESLMRRAETRLAGQERTGMLGPARIDGTLLVLDIVLNPGESGGAVLGPAECLAGIVSARQDLPGSRYSFAVPAGTLRAFLVRQ
ncbi:hypothetical protein [Plastoroseomonas arctica]|uniref:Trypsin-like peptidase domain-containing protein n=1 Tax=Plastoroseomonas arctica TaxID=1509237 RepID=A0AAF1K265_9PROT|nr:hypothetical protein [Plastoroseomonas arctica]MBR0655176.1 trypsin-like peptidase domain-containing protein [Plastoroseomonas arctica]